MSFSSFNPHRGILWIVLYDILCAVQGVYLAHLFQQKNEDPFVVITFSFSMATLFFLILQIPRFSAFVSQFKHNFGLVIWINVATVMAWVGSFLGFKYIEPTIVLAICLGLGPILNGVFWRWLRPQRPFSMRELYLSLGILIGMLILGNATVSGRGGLGDLPIEVVLKGFASSVLAAIGVVLTVVFLKRLAGKGISPHATMAKRFYLLIAVGFVFSPEGMVSKAPFYETFLPTMLAVSALSVILPLYSLQVGIHRSRPTTVLILLCLVPVFTYILQLFDSRLVPSFEILIGVLLTVGFSVWGVLWEANFPNTKSVLPTDNRVTKVA